MLIKTIKKVMEIRFPDDPNYVESFMERYDEMNNSTASLIGLGNLDDEGKKMVGEAYGFSLQEIRNFHRMVVAFDNRSPNFKRISKLKP